jgi:hypothetical protein
MFKWIKEILSYGSGKLSEEYNPEHLVVKLPNISEPVISFLKTVRENPKRFVVDQDCSYYVVGSTCEIPNYRAYRIWDKKLDKGWYVKGRLWLTNVCFISHSNKEGFHPYSFEHASFLSEDEKEYLIKEISSIMNYRINRKAKLDKIRADRRIRDIRNKLKELYK